MGFVSVWNFFCSRKKCGLLFWKRVSIPWYPQPHHIWCLLPQVEFHDPVRQGLHSVEYQRPDTGPGQTQLLPVCSTGSEGLRSGQVVRSVRGMEKQLIPKVMWKTQWVEDDNVTLLKLKFSYSGVFDRARSSTRDPPSWPNVFFH